MCTRPGAGVHRPRPTRKDIPHMKHSLTKTKRASTRTKAVVAGGLVALTAAGIMLRVYLGIMLTLPIEFAEGYRVIAFLCWVPNIALAELYLRRTRQRPTTAALA